VSPFVCNNFTTPAFMKLEVREFQCNILTISSLVKLTQQEGTYITLTFICVCSLILGITITFLIYIHSIGICKMQRFLAILRSFFHSFVLHISFPATLLHQLFFNPPWLHLTIYFLIYRVRHKLVNTPVRHKSVNTPLSHERLVVRTWLAGWGISRLTPPTTIYCEPGAFMG
jgi:hypothetical protein